MEETTVAALPVEQDDAVCLIRLSAQGRTIYGVVYEVEVRTNSIRMHFSFLNFIWSEVIIKLSTFVISSGEQCYFSRLTSTSCYRVQETSLEWFMFLHITLLRVLLKVLS